MGALCGAGPAMGWVLVITVCVMIQGENFGCARLRMNTRSKSKPVFLESEVFLELKRLLDHIPKTSMKGVLIRGPKGLGKTTAMHRLNSQCSDGYYVDLALGPVNPECYAEKQYLFVDNAQEFKRYTVAQDTNLPGKLPTFVIASFSPGVPLDPLKHLRKRIGDGATLDFFFRPLLYSEAEALVKMHGFTITQSLDPSAKDEASVFDKKIISRKDFNYMYSVTNGNPRYIVNSYLEFTYTFQVMEQELYQQYEQSQDANQKDCRLINISIDNEGVM